MTTLNKKNLKRIFSGILAFIMVATTVPQTLMATELWSETNRTIVPQDSMDITDDFTDPVFLEIVRDVSGIAQGPIYSHHLASITHIVYSTGIHNIRSLAGIEHFPSLVVLDLPTNRIDVPVDLSRNTNLEHVRLAENRVVVDGASVYYLTAINLGNNPNLRYLFLSSTGISSLDLTGTPNIATLNIAETPNLTTLLFAEGGMPNLQHIQAFGQTAGDRQNGLTSLSLNNAPNLQAVNLSLNPNLQSVSITNTGMTSFIATHFPIATTDYVDFSNNPNLGTVNFSGGRFSEFDGAVLSPSVHTLNLFNNGLTSLDISTLVNLDYININNNNLTTVDFSQNAALGNVSANNNRFEGIVDFSNNPNLWSVHMSNNYITGMDITGSRIGTQNRPGFFNTHPFDLTNN
ncbi:MAG: hypothetical protein FWB98_08090, partial [Defluviitaleaceae bacterium]|nr:hypothetical protein [Defluviitaleaceae bacterium]